MSLRWLVGCLAASGAAWSCGGSPTTGGHDSTVRVARCVGLAPVEPSLDLTHLGFVATVFPDRGIPPKADLIPTGEPSQVAVKGYTVGAEEDLSKLHSYRFLSPWGAWHEPDVVGNGGTLDNLIGGEYAAAPGRAFQTLMDNARLVRIADGEPIGSKISTIFGDQVPQGFFIPRSLVRLPAGYLLFGVNYSHGPRNGYQAPADVGLFNHAIEVDERGSVAPTGDQVIGCSGPHNMGPLDALSIGEGVLVAMTSALAADDCGPTDGAIDAGPAWIRILRRTSSGLFEETDSIGSQNTSALELLPRSDGAWVLFQNTATWLARLDQRGRVVMGPSKLPGPESSYRDGWSATSLGDRLVIGVRSEAGWSIELIDEGGELVASIPSPGLVDMIASPDGDSILVSRTPDGGEGRVELARYDCIQSP